MTSGELVSVVNWIKTADSTFMVREALKQIVVGAQTDDIERLRAMLEEIQDRNSKTAAQGNAQTLANVAQALQILQNWSQRK